MRVAIALLILGATAIVGDDATACSRPVTPAEQAQGLLAYSGPFDAEIEVRVTAVSPTAGGGWRAVGREFRTISGPLEPREFQFGETELIINSCGNIYEPAVVGDIWTLYLKAGKVAVFLPSDLVAELAYFGPSPRRGPAPHSVDGLQRMPVITPPR